MIFHHLFPVLYLVLMFKSVASEDENIDEDGDVVMKNTSVFLIPGIWSSTILSDSSNQESQKFTECFRHKKMHVWMNPLIFSNDKYFKCMIEILSLRPNNDQNVTFSVPDKIESIAYLGPEQTVPYFNETIDMLLKEKFRKDHIHSLAYDFRFIPENMTETLFPLWKTKIMSAFTDTGHKSIFICHSMGCKMTTEFMKFLGKDFIEKYFRAFYMIAGAYAGSVNGALSLLKGYNFGMKLANNKIEDIRKLAVVLPSTYYLLPSEEYFHESLEITKDGAELRGNDGLETILNMYMKDFNVEMFHNYMKNPKLGELKPILENVPTYCIYGVGVDTILYHDPERFHLGDGDGVVNVESLSACKDFAHEEYIFHAKNNHKTSQYQQHVSILRNPFSQEKFRNILKKTLTKGYEHATDEFAKSFDVFV